MAVVKTSNDPRDLMIMELIKDKGYYKEQNEKLQAQIERLQKSLDELSERLKTGSSDKESELVKRLEKKEAAEKAATDAAQVKHDALIKDIRARDWVGAFVASKGRDTPTYKTYGSSVQTLFTYLDEKLDGKHFLDVRENDINEYIRYNKAKGLRKGTIATYRRNLKNFYKYIILQLNKNGEPANEIMPYNPVEFAEKVKIPVPEPEALTKEETITLINTAKIVKPDIAIIIAVLVDTGMRIAECLALRKKDINFVMLEIRVLHGKGDKERVLPFSDKLKPYLEKYTENMRGDDFLFITPIEGENIKDTLERKYGYIIRNFNKIGLQATIDHIMIKDENEKPKRVDLLQPAKDDNGKVIVNKKTGESIMEPARGIPNPILHPKLLDKRGKPSMHPHLLRHTYASIMIEAPGVKFEAVQKMMGHANSSVTLAHYYAVNKAKYHNDLNKNTILNYVTL